MSNDWESLSRPLQKFGFSFNEKQVDRAFENFCDAYGYDRHEMMFYLFRWIRQCDDPNTPEARDLKRILQYMKMKDTGEYAAWRAREEDFYRIKQELQQRAQEYQRQLTGRYSPDGLKHYYRLYDDIFCLRITRRSQLRVEQQRLLDDLIRVGAVKQVGWLKRLKNVDRMRIESLQASEDQNPIF